MTIVEGTRSITGGVDTHLDVHVAAALDDIGGLFGVESFEATTAGNTRLRGWLASFGPVVRVGVEGTDSYGASLSLRATGVEVVEVDRPNRQARRRTGKSDPADAVEAARAALSGRMQGAGKTRDGNVEASRALVVAKRSARSTRIRSMNQIRHLGFTAPDELRDRLRGEPRRPRRCRRILPTTSRWRSRDHRDQDRDPHPRPPRARPRRRARRHRRPAQAARHRHRGSPTRSPWRRCRHRRHPSRRRRRQPRTLALRSRVGPPLRNRADPGIIGEGHPLETQPRW